MFLHIKLISHCWNLSQKLEWDVINAKAADVNVAVAKWGAGKSVSFAPGVTSNE